jgi:hypothetical protein
MRGENFVAHLDGLRGTPVCRGTPVGHHCITQLYTKTVEAALKNELTARLFTLLPAPGCDLHSRARGNLRSPPPRRVFCITQLIRNFANPNIPESQIVQSSEAVLYIVLENKHCDFK